MSERRLGGRGVARLVWFGVWAVSVVLIGAHRVPAQLAAGVPVLFLDEMANGGEGRSFWAHASAITARFDAGGVTFRAACTGDSPADRVHDLGWTASAPGGLRLSARDQSDVRVHRYIGNDARAWREFMPAFERLRYQTADGGIAIEWHAERGRFAYDAWLAPDADLSQLSISMTGPSAPVISSSGDLLVESEVLRWTQTAPRAWEIDAAGRERPISCRFVRRTDGSVGFATTPRQAGRALHIDPFVVVTSKLSGLTTQDDFLDLTTDAAGNIYATGTSAISQTNTDVVVVRRVPTLATTFFITYLGGTLVEAANRVVVAPNGDLYVAGSTLSVNMPAPGGYRTTNSGAGDAFIARLTALGTLTNGTFLGGNGADYTSGTLAGTFNQINGGLLVDRSGAVVITGQTTSTNFPTTVGAISTSRSGSSDGFVARLAANLGSLLSATYLGGTGDDVPKDCCLDPWGDVLVYGATSSAVGLHTTANAIGNMLSGPQDDFVIRLDPTLTRVIYSTYFGGLGTEFASRIRCNADGWIYIAGWTTSAGLATPLAVGSATPVVGQDVYVARFRPDLVNTTVSWVATLGGAGTDNPNGLAIDEAGNAYVAGLTSSANFPVQGGSTYGGVGTALIGDAFVSCITADGASLLSSRYLGGTGDDIGNSVVLGRAQAANPTYDVYVAGWTTSTSFPGTTAAPAGTVDSFLTVFQAQGGPPRILSVSPSSGPVTGGTTVTITGGDFAIALVGSVRFGSSPPATILTVTPTAITCIAPARPGTGFETVEVASVGGVVRLANAFNYTATGITHFGCPTPQASTTPRLGASGSPVQGAPFAFVGWNGPPNVLGFIVVSGARLTAPAMVGAVPVWVDLPGALPIVPYPSDANGNGFLGFTMPSGPGLTGLSIYTQAGWPDPIYGVFFTSDGMQVTIQ